MTHQSEPVYKSVMGGQIVALQEAIAVIVKAHEGVLHGLLDGADLDEAIYAAADLLSPDVREDDVPLPKKASRAGFEDLGL